MRQLPLLVEDIGPVSTFHATLDQPGLWVIRGEQGAGKTTVLNVVEVLTGRTPSKPLSKRDGSKQGYASFSEREVKVNRTVRHEGELLDVETLADCDLGALITPRFKDPHTRDKERIRILLKLAGVTATRDTFRGIVGDDFDDIVSEDLGTGDAVDVALRVKRDIEKEAVIYERQCEFNKTQVLARSEELAGFTKQELETEITPERYAELDKTLESHIQKTGALRRQQELYEQAQSNISSAADNLDKAKKGYSGRDPKDIQKDVDKASLEIVDVQQQIHALTAKLWSLQDKKEQLDKEFSQAKSFADVVAETHRVLNECGSVDEPDADELRQATEMVSVVRSQIDRLRSVESAQVVQVKVAEMNNTAKHSRHKAASLRVAAGQVQHVLSSMIETIPDCPLFCDTDDSDKIRLVLQTDRSPHEPLDDLSEGERCRLFVGLTLKSNGITVMSQAAYGELQPASRKLLHEMAVDKGAIILTAVADDVGELVCHIYGKSLNGTESKHGDGNPTASATESAV